MANIGKLTNSFHRFNVNNFSLNYNIIHVLILLILINRLSNYY